MQRPRREEGYNVFVEIQVLQYEGREIKQSPDFDSFCGLDKRAKKAKLQARGIKEGL